MNNEIIQIDLGGVNSYLLKCDNGFILVDTGGPMLMDKELNNRLELLENALDKFGCNDKNLKLIIMTHGDIDHVYNGEYLRNKYHTKIAIHKDDAYLIENPTYDDFMSSLNYRSLMFRITAKLMKNTFYKIAVNTISSFKTFSPDILIDDDFKLSDYGFEGEIIHLPGHTLGSIGLLSNKHNLICGDLFANFKKPKIAPNAMDFDMLDKSIDIIKSYSIKKIYPGHGMPFDFVILNK